jgi:hypothetical protein
MPLVTTSMTFPLGNKKVFQSNKKFSFVHTRGFAGM